MTDKPVVWHYGLMAERWAESIHDAPELPFFRQAISRFGQPVLDVACGTGRLLLPLLQAGIDIDGCDISEDMLHHCREKSTHEGFTPHLSAQPMYTFEMARKYKTICICGSFGLAGSRDNDLAALQRCHEHLDRGGALLLNIQAEYSFPESWNLWLAEHRCRLPQPWPENGSRRVAADGSQHIAYFRYIAFDPLEQRCTKQVRLEKWISEKMVASEVYTLQENIYFKHELLLMLKVAGFDDIAVYGDYTDAPATTDHKELVFTAIK